MLILLSTLKKCCQLRLGCGAVNDVKPHSKPNSGRICCRQPQLSGMVLALSLLKIIHMESLDVVTTAVLENFDREFRDLLDF
jgi:hypothetical protein